MLAIGDLAVMVVTAVTGLMVTGMDGWRRHFLLGLLTALYTCLVHVVAFMYFVVSGKIVEQAVGAGQAVRDDLQRVIALKSKALLASFAGIAAIITAAGFGAAIGSWVGPTAHLVAAFSAILINALVFIRQFTLIERNRRLFDGIFDKAGEPHPGV